MTPTKMSTAACFFCDTTDPDVLRVEVVNGLGQRVTLCQAYLGPNGCLARRAAATSRERTPLVDWGQA
jgi:hypothetical protein